MERSMDESMERSGEKDMKMDMETDMERLQEEMADWDIVTEFIGSELAEFYRECEVSNQYQAVFSTLIGRAPTRLGSHWSRASEYCYASNIML